MFTLESEAQSFIVAHGGSSEAGGKVKTGTASTRYQQPYSTTPRNPKPSIRLQKPDEDDVDDQEQDSRDIREFIRFEKGCNGFEDDHKYPLALLKDSEGRVDIFTDGACFGNVFDGAKTEFDFSEIFKGKKRT